MQNAFILRRPRVTKLDKINKTAAMFIKTTFKDSNNVQRIKDYVLKGNLYLYLAIYIYAKAIYIYIYNFCSILDRTKVPDFRRKNAYDSRN